MGSIINETTSAAQERKKNFSSSYPKFQVQLQLSSGASRTSEPTTGGDNISGAEAGADATTAYLDSKLPFRAFVTAFWSLPFEDRRMALRLLVKDSTSLSAQPISCRIACSSRSLPLSLGFMGVPGAPGGKESSGNAAAINWPTVSSDDATAWNTTGAVISLSASITEIPTRPFVHGAHTCK